MTPVYKVRTKHTKEVLEAFIQFSYKIEHGGMTFRLALFGTGFLMIAYLLRDKLFSLIGFGLLGLLIIFFAFMRKRIAFTKLSQNDPNYLHGTEIIFVFGHSNFTVEDKEDGEIQDLRYAQITNMYQDDLYFYIGIDNQNLHILPKSDFEEGSPELFADFLETKVHKAVLPVKVPFKDRIAQAKIKKKQDDEKRDREWEEWKQNRKDKRDSKKE